VSSLVDVYNCFIEFASASELAKLRPYLEDWSYIQMYQCLLRILAGNSSGLNIKSLIETFGSTHETKFKLGQDFEDKKEEKKLLSKCLEEELAK